MFDKNERGTSIKSVASILGAHPTNLRKALERIGYKIPKPNIIPYNLVTLPESEIVQKYQSGSSELSISKEYKRCRQVIRRILESNNVEIRDGSKANFVRMAKLSDDDKKLITKKANEATRGIPEPKSRKLKRAINTENGLCSYVNGIGEDEFEAMLIASNVAYKRQKADGVYSIDFVIEGVAVELKKDSSLSVADKDVKRGRTKALLDAGWPILYVVYFEVSSMLGCKDEILEAIKSMKYSPDSYSAIHCKTERYERYFNEKGQFQAREKAPEFKTVFKEFKI